MMMSEFTERTGIEPTAEEYGMIEEMYYEFDGDKNEFCKDFVKKNRMLEVQREIIAAVREKVEELRKDQISASTYIFNEYIVVATSLGADITAEEVIDLYRYRWQVELYFKRLKPILRYAIIFGMQISKSLARFLVKKVLNISQRVLRLHY